MGVCIETRQTTCRPTLTRVTPYMGVCIETLFGVRTQYGSLSHPIWVCVLKRLLLLNCAWF